MIQGKIIKWSGVTTVFPTDKDGKTSKSFKTFCTAVEHSNNGFKMVWGDKFCDALKGKAVGGVFGRRNISTTMMKGTQLQQVILV